VVRVGLVPNLKEYGKLLQEAIEGGTAVKADAEYAIGAILGALEKLEEDQVLKLTNGHAGKVSEEDQARLADKVGDLLSQRIVAMERPSLVLAVLAA